MAPKAAAAGPGVDTNPHGAFVNISVKSSSLTLVSKPLSRPSANRMSLQGSAARNEARAHPSC